MDLIINYLAESTQRTVFLVFSLLFSLYAWIYIYRSAGHVFLKIAGSFIPLIPIIGPILVLWIFNTPNKQDISKRATMNHYGYGGKFIGNGTNKYTCSDMPDNDLNKND